MRSFYVFASTALLSAFASVTYALGFGELQLESGLNQPLKAEIPLLAVKPVERDQVSVEIASSGTFKRFGIERPAVLDQIDTEIVPGSDDTRLRVLVSSRVAIQEPFLTFLVEANWPAGRAIREYTVLLDPPISSPAVTNSPSATQPRPPAAPLEPLEPAPPPATAAQAAPQPAPSVPPTQAANPPAQNIAPAPRQPPAAKPEPQPEALQQYGPVAPNETLWSIATATRPNTVITQDQMMLALYQANVSAFEGNINLIRAGAYLDVPPASEIRKIDNQVATEEIRDQSSSYKASLQSRTASTKPQAQPKPAEKPKLKLEPATTDASPTVANNSSDTGTPKAQNQPGTEEVAQASPKPESSQTEVIPSETDTADAASSEKNSATLAETGNKPSADPTEQSDISSMFDPPQDSTEASDDTANQGDANVIASNSAASQNDGAVTNNPTNLGDSASGLEQTPDSSGSQSSAENSELSAAPNSAATTDAQTPLVGASEQRSNTDPANIDNADSEGFVAGESVVPADAGALITPQRLLLLLGLILLLLALLMFWSRRRYKPVPIDFKLNADDETPDNYVAPTPTQSPTHIPPAAPASTTAADEPVDVDEVLNDADSHIAYELYDEALAALALGLNAHPAHPDLQCKVLEVHHAAGDESTFFERLDDYFPNISADHPQWPVIADMARDLRPDDPRFALPQASAEPSALTPPIDNPQAPEHAPAATEWGDSSASSSGSFMPSDNTNDSSAYAAAEFKDSPPTQPMDKSNSDTGLDTAFIASGINAEQDDAAGKTQSDDQPQSQADTSEGVIEPGENAQPASQDDINLSWFAGTEDNKQELDSTPPDVDSSTTPLSRRGDSPEDSDKPTESDDEFEFDLSDFDGFGLDDEPSGFSSQAADSTGTDSGLDSPSSHSTMSATSDSGADTEPASDASTKEAMDDPLDFDLSELELSDDSVKPGSDSSLFDDPAVNTASAASSQTYDADLDWAQGSSNVQDDASNNEPAWDADLISEESTTPSDAAEVTELDIEQISDTSFDYAAFDADTDINTDKFNVGDEQGTHNAPADANLADPTPIDLSPIEDSPLDDNYDELADEDEIITKLDLARAYIDMGETDMAKSLLEDVQIQGGAEQKREAESLLQRCS